MGDALISKLKNSAVVIVALALTLTLNACATGSSDVPSPSPTGIAVEEKLLDVVVKLPASFFQNMTPDEIQAKADEAGYSAVVGDDGSVTYTIPQPVYQKMMKDMEAAVEDTIAKDLLDEPSIQGITHDAGFTKFEMTVDRAAFEASMPASFVALGLGLQGMLYQSFDGVPDADRRVEVTYVDGATGETFGSYVLPDAFH